MKAYPYAEIPPNLDWQSCASLVIETPKGKILHRKVFYAFDHIPDDEAFVQILDMVTRSHLRKGKKKYEEDRVEEINK